MRDDCGCLCAVWLGRARSRRTRTPKHQLCLRQCGWAACVAWPPGQTERRVGLCILTHLYNMIPPNNITHVQDAPPPWTIPALRSKAGSRFFARVFSPRHAADEHAAEGLPIPRRHPLFGNSKDAVWHVHRNVLRFRRQDRLQIPAMHHLPRPLDEA